MKFITLGQYFYTLYSVLLGVLLFPIFLFTLSYLISEKIPSQSSALLFACAGLVACDWLVSFILFNKKIKSIRNRQGLRLKLEKYFDITIVRYILNAAGCLLLAYGFYRSGADYFTVLFIINLLLLGLVWPTPAKVCRDLKLKGDEREMVYYKKDIL